MGQLLPETIMPQAAQSETEAWRPRLRRNAGVIRAYSAATSRPSTISRSKPARISAKDSPSGVVFDRKEVAKLGDPDRFRQEPVVMKPARVGASSAAKVQKQWMKRCRTRFRQRPGSIWTRRRRRTGARATGKKNRPPCLLRSRGELAGEPAVHLLSRSGGARRAGRSRVRGASLESSPRRLDECHE